MPPIIRERKTWGALGRVGRSVALTAVTVQDRVVTGEPAGTLGAAAKAGRPLMGVNFWRLFSSSTASNLADGVLVAALPLVAASLTRDPVLVSLVGTLSFLPWLLFAMLAGALVDRVDRRKAMQLANMVRAGILVALALAMLGGLASIWIVYLAAFLLGCAETVYDNAARAMLPRVVDRARLERGNSLLSTSESVANLFLGSPLGAWLFVLAATAPLWVNAAAYVAAAFLIVVVRGHFRPERTESSIGDDMREGLRWLLQHRILRQMVWTQGASAVGFSLANGIVVLYVLETLGVDEAFFGLVIALSGIGAIAGALLAPALVALAGRTGTLGMTGMVAALAMIVMGVWPTLAVALIASAIMSACVSAFNVLIMSVRQVLIPDALFGRVQGVYRTVLWGGIPLGTVAGGAIGAWLGLPMVYIIGGSIALVAASANWWVLHRHRTTIAEAFQHDGE